MHFKVFFDQKPRLTVNDIPSFSKDDYECRFLLQTMNGKPVVISQHIDPDKGTWKVQHGFSSLYFTAFTEAMAYCKNRFCDLEGKPLQKRGEK